MRQEYYILDRAFNMNDKLLHLQYMIIHFKPTLRQIYVIEMRQISYCKKQTNKENKKKNKKNQRE